ncbi:hypothetical protein FN846DRAFT_936256 [Sphaerosporella brunnea]|uniref:DUF676 domain-containing protein n=1 Tax=Sphaerosporella brunnea TaxID=1250544 RepID=A0A5J5F4H4_9PEZI|nr:hypothetical protein FN846DRAFT_936256 [Sphaerosporella brunnea]
MTMDEKDVPPPYSPYSVDTSIPSQPPPLPPRNVSAFSASSLSPDPSISTTFLRDPRTSSQASLLPTESASASGRRTLLLVYIHGFNGNETSFQSFPAHLHNLLTVTLRSGDDYVVHTKVYPKFKTRHAINIATLDFSKWLSAFESETTDIVLLGHSMGGILGAEVILLPSFYDPGKRRHPEILGMIAFDTPFLGMHPGIITSGIASLFRPAPSPPPVEESPGEEQLDPFFAQRPDRNFTIVPSKKPANPWESTLHFIAKHHENLTQATGKYLMSHLEFGACLADPVGLKKRYDQIRALENGGPQGRVRFANYYTISYGREKGVVVKPPIPPEIEDGSEGFGVEAGLETAITHLAVVGAGGSVRTHSRTSSASGSSTRSMQECVPEPMTPDDSPLLLLPDAVTDDSGPEVTADIPCPAVEIVPSTPISPIKDVEASFPPMSPPPVEPTLQEIPDSVDKHLRKALERENKRLKAEYERQMKEYGKLVKDREKAISKVYQDREKERKKKEKDEEKGRAEQEKVRLDQQKAELGRQKQQAEDLQKRLRKEQEDVDKRERDIQKLREKELQKAGEEKAKAHKQPRQRKFCIVPSQPDYTWTPVEMKGVDEVGAHCGLFFVGEVYAKLVGDVADRIERWVDDERTRRVIEESMGKMD